MKDHNNGSGFLFRLFFKRNPEADKISDYPNWRIGLSSAASWSWGVSIAVGFSIMYKWGLIPFLIWTAGNVLALPFFGLVRTRLPLSKHWPQFLVPMVILFFFVEFFCIILNLQGLLTAMGGVFVKYQEHRIPTYEFPTVNLFSYSVPHELLVVILGLVIIWYVRKGGLRVSVLTDFAQYAIQLGAVMLLAGLGYYMGSLNGVELIGVDQETGKTGLQWASFGFQGIIVGALSASHHWQRFSAISEERILPTSLWGGTFFAVYMLFVGLAGMYYHEDLFLGLIFLVIMLSLAMSSIDSAAAGLEYVVARVNLKPYWATLLASIAVIFWPLISGSPIADIWSFMASVRLPIIKLFLAITLIITLARSDRFKKLLIATKIYLKS